MIILKKYQETAVDELMEKTVKLLNNSSNHNKLVFKAPTGSGKTVMMSALLNKICEEFPDRTDIRCPNVAFVWIAPNKLHLQSYKSIKSYFSDIRTVRPIQFDDVTDGRLYAGEVLFVNWESINKESNTLIKENETGKNLYNYINAARIDNTEIVVIIDEEHMFGGRNANRSRDVLRNIFPKLEIRVSATPETRSDYHVIVERKDVIAEEMIKEGIILNPSLEAVSQTEKTVNQALLENALAKRNEIAQAYKQLGVNINPLLLVQLPNDNNDTISTDDKTIIEEVKAYLDVYKSINEANEKLAIWLSENKSPHLEDITKPDSLTEVLLFKQAIALGWDCPRAAVLLIFRDLHSSTFTVQTVGRILRMPEQKYYPDSLLNQGYVYTNLSKNQIEVVRDDMNYISTSPARRIKTYQEGTLSIESTYFNIVKPERNRLGSNFRKTFNLTAEKFFGVSKELDIEAYVESNRLKLKNRMIDLDVVKLDVVIPENVILTGGEQLIDANETVHFAKTQGEINKLFMIFCRNNIGTYAPVDSSPILASAIEMFFEEYLEYFNVNAYKIVLHETNSSHFAKLIGNALDEYSKEKEKAEAKIIKTPLKYKWEVPEERIYHTDLYNEKELQSHALQPFFEYNKALNPELSFAQYLNKNGDHIEWWYKNGDKGKEHFAVPYVDYAGRDSLFYVDFIILLKNGTRCLFDTKTPGSDSANVHLKHNALLKYIEQLNKEGKPTIGGVIIKQDGNDDLWRYSEFPIDNTLSQKGWTYFGPQTHLLTIK